MLHLMSSAFNIKGRKDKEKSETHFVFAVERNFPRFQMKNRQSVTPTQLCISLVNKLFIHIFVFAQSIQFCFFYFSLWAMSWENFAEHDKIESNPTMFANFIKIFVFRNKKNRKFLNYATLFPPRFSPPFITSPANLFRNNFRLQIKSLIAKL